jgi:signal transduction histidine kinase/ActR/RegA family two-component response regulator/uncharacterized membrane protein
MNMTHSYNPVLVAVSLAIAMLAAFSALDLVGRVNASAGRIRTMWIAGGGIAMGFGIWSMHFIAMLAFSLPVSISYDEPLVVLSLLVAMGASGFALWTASRSSRSQVRLATAAVAMGVAIAGMHYIGMAAMEMNANITWNWVTWWTSIAIAIVVSYIALNVFVLLGADGARHIRLLRAAASVVMGFAVAGMHYTGMAAASFSSGEHGMTMVKGAIPPGYLAVAIAIATIVVAGISLTAAMLDRVLAARTIEAELRAAKDAAERTNRAKSEFLSNMSHELRTPLNSVIGFANIILKNKNKTLSEQDIAYMSRIVANGKHLLGLINGILDLSKVEAGRVELEIAPVSAGDLVREVVAELEGQTAGRDIALSAIVPGDVEVFDADRSKLKQILINLVGNALKFTQHGSVVVRVARDDKTGRPSRIDVIDTGVGIPADRLEAVFEAFQQADNTTSRQFGGTGLGLTITRSLAQMMGFDIRVTSELGKGSTFSIIIEEWSAERANTVVTAPTPVEAVSAAANTKGVKARALALIIDDDPDSRSVLSHHLRSLGCEVATARGADEGIAIARKLKPDLITLDVMMPRKSGVEALHDFQTDPVLRHIPIVLVSVVAEEHRGRVFGVAEFVEKPVTSEVLHDVLDRTVPQLALVGAESEAN